jgi:hypothetical protein
MVGNSYRGEPLFRVSGQIDSVGSFSDKSREQMRVSLFWSRLGQGNVQLQHLREQPSASASVRFPNTFEISIFYPPEASHLVPETPSYGLGLLLVYEDVDGDGRFSASSPVDELRGGALNRVLLYTATALPAHRSPLGMALPAGFSLAPLPIPCVPPGAAAVASPDCAPQIGRDCIAGAQHCGSWGRCMHAEQRFGHAQNRCVHSFGTTTCVPQDGLLAEVTREVWMPACARDGDCARPGYGCTTVGSWAGEPCRVCWPENAGEADFVCEQIGVHGEPLPECQELVGKACADHDSCNDSGLPGECLTSLSGVEFPGGYCITRDLDSGYHCASVSGYMLHLPIGYWIDSCQTDRDCPEGTTCDPTFAVCRPDDPVRLDISGGFDLEGSLAPLFCWQ